MKIDAFATGSRTDENPWPVGSLESPFRRKFGAVVATAKDSNALARVSGVDLAPNEIDGSNVRCKDDDLLVWILLPERSKTANQFLDFGLATSRETLKELAG